MNVKRFIVGVITVSAFSVAAAVVWWTLKYESLVGHDIRQVVQQMTASGSLLVSPERAKIYQNCENSYQVYMIPKGFPSLIVFEVDGCLVERVNMGWRK